MEALEAELAAREGRAPRPIDDILNAAAEEAGGLLFGAAGVGLTLVITGTDTRENSRARSRLQTGNISRVCVQSYRMFPSYRFFSWSLLGSQNAAA